MSKDYTSILIESLSFTYTANGKRQTANGRFKLRISQIENEQIKTVLIWIKNCVKLLIYVCDKQRGKLVTWYKFAFAV